MPYQEHEGPADCTWETSLRVAVVGTGALGSALLEQLAKKRVGSVLLIDPDAVEERNLPVSPFLKRASENARKVVGISAGPGSFSSKAEVLAMEAEHTYQLAWHPLSREIADVGWEDLSSVDIICCCTDSALSRSETTYIARMLRKPMLDGAVFGDGIPGGRVTVFAPRPEAACYLCGLGESSRAQILGYAASTSMGCRLPQDAPAMTGTMAALQHVARTMMKMLTHAEHPNGVEDQSYAIRLSKPHLPHTERLADWNSERVLLTQSLTCPWHEAEPERLQPLPWTAPLCDSLRPSQEVQLAWPICTEAVCAACHARTEPFQRVAAVRRKARCPRCGEPQLQPVRAVHRIRPGSAPGSMSPKELGLPERHLYWLVDGAV